MKNIYHHANNSEKLFEDFTLSREVDSFGNVYYFDKDKQYHRNFGPAIEFCDGSYSWYKHGILHRIGGLAVGNEVGLSYYFINGRQYSREDYWKEVERLKNGN